MLNIKNQIGQILIYDISLISGRKNMKVATVPSLLLLTYLKIHF